MILRTLALATAALISTGVDAQTSLQLHGFSWHAQERGSGRVWNERNVGLGIRHMYSDTWSVQAGAFRNSVDRTTVYVVGNYTPLQLGMVRAGVFDGLGTGYQKPVLAGGMVEIGPVSVRIIPPLPNVTPLTIGFELGIPF